MDRTQQFRSNRFAARYDNQQPMRSTTKRWGYLIPLVAIVWFVAAVWRADYVSNLPVSDAERLISQAPEFHRYARLIRVGSIYQGKDSMKRRADGNFSFNYLDRPGNSPAISGRAAFFYSRGAWYLGDFDYGCPDDCHSVQVYIEPEDHSNALREYLRFVFFVPN